MFIVPNSPGPSLRQQMSHALIPHGELEEARAWLNLANGEDHQEKAPRPAAGKRRYSYRRRPAVHLVLGDSVGRDARLASRYHRDLVIDRCRGGATWTTVLKNLQDDLLPWLHAKDTFHLEPGHIIIWLSGNDSHSRSTGLGRISDELNLQVKVSVRETLLRLSEKQPAAIIVLGPLPRPDGQVSGLAWEKTASYHQERAAKEAIQSAEDLLHCPATLVLLGRALNKKSGGRHSVTAECQGA